jgi:hypothetical protein
MCQATRRHLLDVVRLDLEYIVVFKSKASNDVVAIANVLAKVIVKRNEGVVVYEQL